MKKLSYSLFIFFSLVLFTGCSEDDELELFDENPDQRMESKLNGYKEQLTGAGDPGWKVIYYPDSTSMGGWTFLMKFNEDNSVEMIGDVLPDPEIEQGVYELLASQGPVLNFASFLPITELTNPSSAYPESRHGSNEFIFRDTDFEGNIHLVSKTNKAPFVLQPAEAGDWTEILEHAKVEQAFIGGGENAPSLFRTFEVTNGSETVHYRFSYDAYLNFLTLTPNGNTEAKISRHGVAFSKDSVFLNPPLNFNGAEIKRMALAEDGTEFIGKADNTTARLYYSDKPLVKTDAYLVPFDNFMAYIYTGAAYLGHPLDVYTTNSYLELFMETNASLNQYGLSLQAVRIYFNYNDDPTDNRIVYHMSAGGQAFSAHVFVDLVRENNKIYLKEEGIAFTSNAISFLTYENFKPLHDFYFDPEGLYVENPGTFLNFTNQAFTLVSASKPTVRVLSFFAE